MKQKKLVSTEPVLRHFSEDLAKKWYWEWYDEKGKRRKLYGDINKRATVEERLSWAEVDRACRAICRFQNLMWLKITIELCAKMGMTTPVLSLIRGSIQGTL